jgi:hypothetical protein
MKPKKKTGEEKMNDEEYRLNYDILEKIAEKNDSNSNFDNNNKKTSLLF